MKKVKYWVLAAVVFIGGWICGAVCSSHQFKSISLAPFYSSSLNEVATDAIALHKGESMKVLKRKTAALPSLARTYYEAFSSSMPKGKARYSCLWQVERFYEISGEEIPKGLMEVFDSIPERPESSCEKQQQKAETSKKRKL
ncbi:hypothetical protein L21SP3_00365 [Sedimentisphaera cyanobacteriorum]|uniref:Uncharacterized protein n=1 Tax=Sedimentisphaera cyanobacteriorum TaxID=1940790 RepID=A0A1Q2HM92_9BACT|nr:hypothetical protein [Sedimentisphaera cyanobacteriorum]AQQ08578.1 hypothetical protein L21SP3_00365 [Sedimentisphaera cyanobacteriorum]